MSEPTPPLLIALPDGLNVSGVTMWAARLVNTLVARGGAAGLILHPEPAEQRRIGIKIDSRVRVFRVEARFGERPGDLSAFIPRYRDAVRAMGEVVVLSPNLHGDCYGVAAALCLTEPERVRVLGWQHSDIEYDARVLARYEPMLSRCVAVSDAIEKGLVGRLEARRGPSGYPESPRVVNVPYGVNVPEKLTRGRGEGGRGAVKLLYSGRIEHMQKRVMALVRMSDELERRGVKHVLTIVGDGPGAAALDAKVKERVSVRRLAPVGPRGVEALLEEHDALVLPSRYEGLSVAVLEAMARGCVPIVARTRSGAEQAITPGETGEIAEVGPEADEEEVGFAMAGTVERFLTRDRAKMSEAAWRRARELFSIEKHVERVVGVMREVAGEAGRAWPADRACAFTARSTGGTPVPRMGERAGETGGMPVPRIGERAGETGGMPVPRMGERAQEIEVMGASGSVPADGAARMRAVLESLRGRAVVIHGTGEHTRQLREVIVGAPVKLVAFTDDDRGQHGKQLWDWPVVSPREVGKLGATDVVISSWMHQEAVWARRGMYEEAGVRVWRVYA